MLYLSVVQDKKKAVLGHNNGAKLSILIKARLGEGTQNLDNIPGISKTGKE